MILHKCHPRQDVNQELLRDSTLQALYNSWDTEADCVESTWNEVGSGKLEVLKYHLFGLADYTVHELLYVCLSPTHLNYESCQLKAEGVYMNKADVCVCGDLSYGLLSSCFLSFTIQDQEI